MPSMMLVCLVAAWFLCFIIYSLLKPRRNRLIQNFLSSAMVELPSYFEVLSAIEQKRWLTHIVHMEQGLGIKKQTEDLKVKLMNTRNDPDRKFIINGLSNYDLIKNERYQYLFQYIPIEFRSPFARFNFNLNTNEIG